MMRVTALTLYNVSSESALAATCWTATEPTEIPISSNRVIQDVGKVAETSTLPHIELTDGKTDSASECGHVVDESDGLLEYKSKVSEQTVCKPSEPDVIVNLDFTDGQGETVPVEASIDFLSIPRAPPPTRNVSQNDLADGDASPAKANTIEDVVKQGKGGFPPITTSPKDRMCRKRRRDRSLDDTEEEIQHSGKQVNPCGTGESGKGNIEKPQLTASLTEKMGCLAASNFNTMSYEVLPDRTKPTNDQKVPGTYMASAEKEIEAISTMKDGRIQDEESSGKTGSSDTNKNTETGITIKTQNEPKTNCGVCLEGQVEASGKCDVGFSPGESSSERTVRLSEEEVEDSEKGNLPAPPPSRCISREFSESHQAEIIDSEELSKKVMMCHEKSSAALESNSCGTPDQVEDKEDAFKNKPNCNSDQISPDSDFKEGLQRQTSSHEVQKHNEPFEKYILDNTADVSSEGTVKSKYEELFGSCDEEILKAPPPSRSMSREFSEKEVAAVNISEELKQRLMVCQEESVNLHTEPRTLVHEGGCDMDDENSYEQKDPNDGLPHHPGRIQERDSLADSDCDELAGQCNSSKSHDTDGEAEDGKKVETSVICHHKPIFDREKKAASCDNGISSDDPLSNQDPVPNGRDRTKPEVEEEKIMIDGGESQAFSDMCEEDDAQICSESSEELLSEVEIFGRLPPPYGYEEAATSFGEDADGKSSAALAFSPPSGFRDWEHCVDSDDDIEVIRVRPNTCSTPLTYSVVNNYDSRLYTHYEESEEDSEVDGESKHSGSTTGKTESETMDSLVFDLDGILPEGGISIRALEESGLDEEPVVDISHFGGKISQSEEVQNSQLAEMGVYVSGADIVVLDDDMSENEEEVNAGGIYIPDSIESNEGDLSPDSIDGGSGGDISPDSMDRDSLGNDGTDNSSNDTVVLSKTPDEFDTAVVCRVFNAPETSLITLERGERG